MANELLRRIALAEFGGPGEDAILSLLITAEQVRAQLNRACAEHGITIGQYNVLRILREFHPRGVPRCDLMDRMMVRAPDVTRLIDRLQKRGLVKRNRSAEDRRLSMARITGRGLALLGHLNPTMDRVQGTLAARLTREEQRALVRICTTLLGDDEE